MPLQHMSFDQTAPGKPESSRTKKRLHDFNPAAPEKRIVDPNRYAALVHKLSLCQPDVPFLTTADGLYFYRHFIMPISVQNCLLKHQTSQQLNQ